MKAPSSQSSTNRKPLLEYLRRWFRKVWDVRGGGLYAVGYGLTFLYFEITSIFGDILESDSVGDFFRNQVFEFLVRFAGETIQNMVYAFMWPVYLVRLDPMWGGIILGLAFWLFPITLKKPIEAWLFRDEKESS